MFKKYEKQYEDVFTNEKTTKKCNLELVSTDVGMSVDEYMLKIRNEMEEFHVEIFNRLVKLTWLFRRFCYRGRRRKHLGSQGYDLDGSFGVFMRRYVGFDQRTITRYYLYRKVISYFDDFFPGFDIGNPFTEEYEYPYKYMKMDMLFLVYQMPERLDLLKIGEERKMNLTQFEDYVINYIKCYNEEHGAVYDYCFWNGGSPYIKYERKKVQTGGILPGAKGILPGQCVSTEPSSEGDEGNAKS